MKSLAGVLLMLLGNIIFFPVHVSAAQNISIIYSGNLNGELEPCGCTKEGDMGGIRRQLTMLERLRKQNPDLFLLSSGGMLAIDMATDRIKSQFILQGMTSLNYDAIGIQSRDLAYGVKFLGGETLPWVSSNHPANVFVPSRQITHGKVTMQFFSWLTQDSKQLQMMHGKALNKKPQLQGLGRDIKQAKQSGRLTVLSTSLKLDKVKQLLPLDYVDILLIESAHEVFGRPRQIKHTLVLQPGSRGMRLGHVELAFNSKRGITSFTHKVIDLPTAIPEAPSLAAWYENYNAALKQDYLKRVELRKASESGESPYVGADKCQACHQAAYKTWQQSRHAHAFESLAKVNKTFDPNCIGCHTVAYEKSGGFIDEQITEHLMNVQCESCHGASRAHTSQPASIATQHKGWPMDKMCGQCHIGNHSPSFELKQYWPKLAH